MKNKEFNTQDAFRTIEEALNQSKKEKTGAAFYYMLWGTILLIHYLILFTFIQYPYLKDNKILEIMVWGIFPIGGLFSYVRSRKDRKDERALSHYEKVYLFGFGGFILAYSTILIASALNKSILYITFFPLLLGLVVFIVGGITKRKISIFMGIIGILCTGISLNSSIEIQCFLAAFSSIICCIIPGYLMKIKNA